MSSYQRQIQTKQTELNRINKSITNARTKMFDKQAQINKLNNKLTRELKSEQAKADALVKKQRQEDTKFAKEQEKGLDRQIKQQKTLTKAIVNRSNSFSEHIAGMEWKPSAHENSEYEINEVVQINGRIDEVLAKLNEIGLGQSILFDEIEELKGKSKKISRKDLRLLTIGKLVSFATKEISPSQLDDIFKLITGADVETLIG
jgi:chromosome segregation ATPase